MSERSPSSMPLLRYGAVALSFGLAALVVVNAQLGCDAPKSAPPPAADAEPSPEPSPEAQAGPTTSEAPAAHADAAQPEAPAASEAMAEPAPNAAPDGAPNAAPVLMPASKSGGDFGAMGFPGQKAGVLPPAQAEQAQRTHEAQQAQQAPSQQAPQP